MPMEPNHDPFATVLGALCSDGPILDAFAVSTADIEHGTAADLALEFLRSLTNGLGATAPTPSSHADTLERLGRLADPVREELERLSLRPLARWIQGIAETPTPNEAAEHFWEVFSPNSVGLLDSWDHQVESLREQRSVTIAPDGFAKNTGHILFTSNALLTAHDTDDEQRWFFDHPMVIGAAVASNEIVHGLRGLNAALAFEKDRGTLDRASLVDCVLSVSVTHESLAPFARDEVNRSVAAAGPLEHLAVYAFTEADSDRLVTEVLGPAINCDPSLLDVFGVNGNYGRHYSFTKAIAALWQTVMDPEVDRTFKIDLDQVFPQEHLVAETGMSALELLTMGRWGAIGTDEHGRQVELGMCAGALVTESDIHHGLFTPDVERPTSAPSLPDLMFRKAVPQSLSTEAEMMDRGDEPPGAVRQRVHVTGGTIGITVDALMRHRPFTPSFISRAEDQAYLLSALVGPDPSLRTAHIPGLFMRHDKETVATTAVLLAEVGTAVSDYERTILFTGYARALRLVDTDWLGPFIGSYITQAPLATTLIRLLLDVIDRETRGESQDASDLLELGVRHVSAAHDLALAPDNRLSDIVADERAGWDRYYDAVAAVAEDADLAARARTIIESTRLT